MRHMPETNITTDTINAAKAVLRTLTEEELTIQRRQLTDQANSIPMEMADLADHAHRIAEDIKKATLLTTLTGEAGSDMAKLDELSKAVNKERSQRRIDLERVTTMGKLVDEEIQYRAQNRIYRAVMAQIEGWKCDLPDAIHDAKESLAEAIALYCLVRGGMTPENLVARDFVPNVLGDVQKRANEVFNQRKMQAVEHHETVGIHEEERKAAEADAVARGRARKAAEYEAFKRGKVPGNLETE